MNATVFSSPEPHDDIVPTEPPPMMVGNPTLMRRNRFSRGASVRTIAPIVLLALIVAGLVAAVTYHRARPAPQQVAQAAPLPATPSAADSLGVPAPAAPAAATPAALPPAPPPVAAPRRLAVNTPMTPRRAVTRARSAADSGTDAGATGPLYPPPAVASATPSVTRSAAAPSAPAPVAPAAPAPTFPYPAASAAAPTPAAPVPVNPVVPTPAPATPAPATAAPSATGPAPQ